MDKLSLIDAMTISEIKETFQGLLPAKGWKSLKKEDMVRYVKAFLNGGNVSQIGKASPIKGEVKNDDETDTKDGESSIVSEENSSEAYQLFEECLKTYPIKQLSGLINVGSTYLKKWKDKKKVSKLYLFPLYRILGKEPDYSVYSPSQKDQFFTPLETAQQCWKSFINLNLIEDLSEFTFIEPSAGDGVFLKVLPENTLAFDIEPRNDAIVKQDYLKWNPPVGSPLSPNEGTQQKRYIVFGNPPFGMRCHTALQFINYSGEFAEYVCFILPQMFESDGRGCAKNRVKGLHLIHSEPISPVFKSPNNEEITIHCVFQVWSKHPGETTQEIKKRDDIEVYYVSDGEKPGSVRNKDKIGHCDVYLPSTCFQKAKMKAYSSFEELPGKKGIGLIFKDNKEKQVEKAFSIDWSEVSFLATNSSYNLRTSLILNQF